jgi:hypothetical protein
VKGLSIKNEKTARKKLRRDFGLGINSGVTQPNSATKPLGRMAMASDHNGSGEGSSRRKVLECMTWAGTGILWTVTGGVPKSLNLLGGAEAATAAAQSFTFAQISDSHIGFHVKESPRQCFVRFAANG